MDDLSPNFQRILAYGETFHTQRSGMLRALFIRSSLLELEGANITPASSAAEQTQAATQIVAQVSALLTQAPSPVFQQTVEQLAATKGADIAVNNCGTVKTAAVASDALGNNIASAGVVKNVTNGALIMLMSVNADGTIEYVEGIVDPVTGAVLGAFKGVPSVITVLVLA